MSWMDNLKKQWVQNVQAQPNVEKIGRKRKVVHCGMLKHSLLSTMPNTLVLLKVSLYKKERRFHQDIDI